MWESKTIKQENVLNFMESKAKDTLIMPIGLLLHKYECVVRLKMRNKSTCYA